jgi:hypothetical protein
VARGFRGFKVIEEMRENSLVPFAYFPFLFYSGICVIKFQ